MIKIVVKMLYKKRISYYQKGFDGSGDLSKYGWKNDKIMLTWVPTPNKKLKRKEGTHAKRDSKAS